MSDAVDQVAQPQCETIDPRLLDIAPFSDDNTASYFSNGSIEFQNIDWSLPSPPIDTDPAVQQLQSPGPDFMFTQLYDDAAVSAKSALSQPQPQRQPQPQPHQVLDDYHVVSAMKAAILDLAPAIFGTSFRQQHACIFSVVTARDLSRDQITVALIAYTEHDRSRWVKVARGDQYWESLQMAMTILLASLEGIMAEILRSCVLPAKI